MAERLLTAAEATAANAAAAHDTQGNAVKHTFVVVAQARTGAAQPGIGRQRDALSAEWERRFLAQIKGEG